MGLVIAAGALGLLGWSSGLGAVSLVGEGSTRTQAVPLPVNAAPSNGVHPVRVSDAFVIQGNVSGLFPGADIPVQLMVTNLESFPIVVTSIRTHVSALSPGCRGSNLKLSVFAGQLPVGGNGTATTTVSATMPRSAPNSCQGATFVLQYRGRATAS
ncbi:MAG TPA: hypothetical protein VK277_07240 [Acidimicrobiales bacterium]|nr:hypothetical protein [Acidimicrobiales bacterium]